MGVLKRDLWLLGLSAAPRWLRVALWFSTRIGGLRGLYLWMTTGAFKLGPLMSGKTDLGFSFDENLEFLMIGLSLAYCLSSYFFADECLNSDAVSMITILFGFGDRGSAAG